MKNLFLLIFLFCLRISFAQNSQVLPNSVLIPTVSSLPMGSAGALVFKTPENSLYTFDGISWNLLQAAVKEGFSSQIGNFNNCCPYPNLLSSVYLKTPDFKYGNGVLTNSSYTVEKSGLYQFSVSFSSGTFDASPSIFFLSIFIYKNSTIARFYTFNNHSSAFNASSSASDFIQLNTGDVIQMKISNNYTGNLSINSDGSYLSLLKVY
jgi:hypothetical protein